MISSKTKWKDKTTFRQKCSPISGDNNLGNKTLITILALNKKWEDFSDGDAYQFLEITMHGGIFQRELLTRRRSFLTGLAAFRQSLDTLAEVSSPD